MTQPGPVSAGGRVGLGVGLSLTRLLRGTEVITGLLGGYSRSASDYFGSVQVDFVIEI